MKLYLFQDGHPTLYQAVSVWKSKYLKMSFPFEKRLKNDETFKFFFLSQIQVILIIYSFFKLVGKAKIFCGGLRKGKFNLIKLKLEQFKIFLGQPPVLLKHLSYYFLLVFISFWFQFTK